MNNYQPGNTRNKKTLQTAKWVTEHNMGSEGEHGQKSHGHEKF